MQWHGIDATLEDTGSEKTPYQWHEGHRIRILPSIKSAVSTDCHLATVPMLVYDRGTYRITPLRAACVIR